MSGENPEFDELADFKAYLDEREAKPAKERKRPERPVVQEIGPGPEPKVGPFCRGCNDTRRLVPVAKGPDGNPGYLCRTCIKQLEYDRAKRCVWCQTPSRKRLIDDGGLCRDCAAAVEAQANLVELVKLRWVGVIRGD
jgi:hypothetical protein